ncbi:MAG: alpha-galactosidase, partial [Pseudoflavonifractor sp.]
MLKLTESEGSLVTFVGNGIRVAGVTAGVELLEGTAPAPVYGPGERSDFALAGMEGSVLRQHARTDGLALTREIFSSGDESVLAMRLTVANISGADLSLDKVSLLRCNGNSSLLVGGPMQTFRCLKLGRHKLDVPTVFRPSVVDDCHRDASFQAHKLRAGLGVQGNTKDYYSMDKIYSEPAFFVKNDWNDKAEGLGMCVLGQSRHLTSFILSPSEDKQSLKQFDISLEFDGVLLPPGGEQRTHWVMFYTAPNEGEAIGRYSDLLAAHMGVTGQQERVTLYCSWYFYGREFYEEDLIENIEQMKARHVPVDAFIIDNGWMDNFGDFNGNGKFPGGMAKMADIIGEAGFAPGLWTCPFLLMPHSKTFAAHPELAAKNRAGEYSMFSYIECDCHVVDPTSPYCREYFEELYHKISAWGFRYHKMDFMRAPTVNDDIVFHDRGYNRASAYRLGHQLLREAIGKDGYLLSCGGIYDSATIGLADSVRSGSDSVGSWTHPFAGREGGSKIQVKQAMMRNYLSRFYNLDPDSLMLRRRSEPFRKHASPIHDILSNGLFTDAEARTMVAKQYICGGSVDFSERMAELPDDRLKLLSTLIPPVTKAARVLDYDNPDTPTLCLTEIAGPGGLYHTLTVFNWNDEPLYREIAMGALGLPEQEGQVALFEFFEQRFMGVVGYRGSIKLQLPAHGAACVRLTPVQEGRAALVGTDCHMSMGGCELAELRETAEKV